MTTREVLESAADRWEAYLKQPRSKYTKQWSAAKFLRMLAVTDEPDPLAAENPGQTATEPAADESSEDQVRRERNESWPAGRRRHRMPADAVRAKLAELRAACGKATQIVPSTEHGPCGPWMQNGPDGFRHDVYETETNETIALFVDPCDGAFAVAARNNLPALIDALEALLTERELRTKYDTAATVDASRQAATELAAAVLATDERIEKLVAG